MFQENNEKIVVLFNGISKQQLANLNLDMLLNLILRFQTWILHPSRQTPLINFDPVGNETLWANTLKYHFALDI